MLLQQFFQQQLRKESMNLAFKENM